MILPLEGSIFTIRGDETDELLITTMKWPEVKFSYVAVLNKVLICFFLLCCNANWLK